MPYTEVDVVRIPVGLHVTIVLDTKTEEYYIDTYPDHEQPEWEEALRIVQHHGFSKEMASWHYIEGGDRFYLKEEQR